MATLPQTVGVAVDLAGCPNRCRHCRLGIGPNQALSREVLQKVAEAFWNWVPRGQEQIYFDQVYVSSWYREPDFCDCYREMYELERELSRCKPRRYELLSIWRLARDPEYAQWAKEVGPRVCQITFFGLEKVNDYFYRRPEAFSDCVKATERLLEAGIIPRWQILLTKPGIRDLDGLLSLIDELRLGERVAELGQEFDVFCQPPGPQGEGWYIEDLRIEETDLPLIPDELMASTRKHYGGEIKWDTESALIRRALRGESIPSYVPPETWFLINSHLGVFSNYGELTPAWRLGNFRTTTLDAMFRVFEEDAAPGLWASFHVPDTELARRFGRKDSRRIYWPEDLKSRWTHTYTSEQQDKPER